MRPESIDSYKVKDFNGGKVFIEEEYENILFAKDGEIYDFNNRKCIVLGGAYSVDKFYRLQRGYNWFSDEQPSDEIKDYVCGKLDEVDYKVDTVLSHTCQLKYEPTEVFLDFIDQSNVDKSTEKWLDDIEDKLIYDKWYCGHYHTEKQIDKLEFLYKSIVEFI